MCGGCDGGGGVCGRGGKVPSISFFLLHMLDTSNYCFPLKIYWVYPGALLRHFIEYAILRGLVELPLYGARGEALWQKMVFRHSKGLK